MNSPEDEILYTDLTAEEMAALDEAVALMVIHQAQIAAQRIRNRIDADDISPASYDGYGAPPYGWQIDGGT